MQIDELKFYLEKYEQKGFTNVVFSFRDSVETINLGEEKVRLPMESVTLNFS